ncbi:TPR-repeat-containing protein [Lysobacter dokdonensis DS-58]|uniref:TPR-repeat-containing protein n=1 Tax=Lysobacter dokdonensis DS-58 TaxID=1300345 RepID=A0A0A2WKP4_9GAMM|nr:hypothetical protein [Lysobacter dokdonensis]KGQ18845.1 TPR-repeat-containing protein [Lysobacter dokdonensis DS-58]
MRSSWRTVAAALALVVLVFAVYWPGRAGGFIFDDQQNLQRNAALLAVDGFDTGKLVSATFSSPENSTVGRPLAMFTFALNHATTGPDPVPMKLTNIALHAVNALLVAGLVLRLLALPAFAGVDATRRRWAALFVATAWALHPLHATAVLYLVQRMEVLAHTCVFAGLLLYVVGRARQVSGRAGGMALALIGLVGGTAVGVLSKESAALLPLYALCLELCVLGFRGRAGVSRPAVFAWSAVVAIGAGVALFWLLPRVMPVYVARDFTLVERLLTESRVVWQYLQWSVLPTPSSLGLFHDDIAISHGLFSPVTTVLAVAGLLALAALAWWLRTRRPLAALGIAWFLAAHVLTGTIIPLELAYEHRNYFAALGVCLVFADLLFLLPSEEARRRGGVAIAVVLLVTFGGVTALRAYEWRDPVDYTLREAAKRPASPRAQFEAARTLVRLTRYDPRSPLLPTAWAALERARAVPGSGVLPHQSAITLAALTGAPEPAAWWDEMNQRLRTQPMDSNNLTAVVALGDCAADGLCQFPPARMAALYEAALARTPNPMVLASAGKYALHVRNDPALALRLWTEAVVRAPKDAQLRYNRARLLLEMGDRAGARAERDTLAHAAPLANRPLVDDLDARLQDASPR